MPDGLGPPAESAPGQRRNPERSNNTHVPVIVWHAARLSKQQLATRDLYLNHRSVAELSISIFASEVPFDSKQQQRQQQQTTNTISSASSMISLSPPYSQQHSGSPPAQRSRTARSGNKTPPCRKPSRSAAVSSASLLPPSVDICCDGCQAWYITSQVGLSVEEAEALRTWHCGACLGARNPAAHAKQQQHGAAAAKKRKRSVTKAENIDTDSVSSLQSQLTSMAQINAQQQELIDRLLAEREAAEQRLCELEGADALPTREMELSEVAVLYNTLSRLDAEQIGTACSFAQVRAIYEHPSPVIQLAVFAVSALTLLRSGFIL